MRYMTSAGTGFLRSICLSHSVMNGSDIITCYYDIRAIPGVLSGGILPTSTASALVPFACSPSS